jgi:sugar/nucleoside kinase (ribokinase family)
MVGPLTPPEPPRPESGAPDLVVIGNFLVDDMVFPDGRTRMGEAGGACLYAALGAALWGARVAAVGVRGADYPAGAIAALEGAGIDLSGVRVLDGPGLRTWLLYETTGRRVVHRLGPPSHPDVSPGRNDLPTHCLDARAFHIAPMPLDRQQELVQALASRRESGISVDPHEPVTDANLARWREVLGRADAFFVSEEELLLEDADDDPHAALRRLTGGRLRFIALKQGNRGGILHDARNGTFTAWPPVPRLTGEPTGAGDAFAGGFLAAVIRGGTIEDALDQATISASFALEDWGARGLMQARADDARRRRREWLGSGG